MKHPTRIVTPIVLVSSLWLNVFDARPAGETPAHLVPRSGSITLPSRLDENCFHLDASVGGEAHLNFVLDTGASVPVISEALAARLRKANKLRDIGGSKAATPAGDRVDVKIVEISDIRFGDFVVSNSTAAVMDLSTIGRAIGETVDGCAGVSLFESGTLVMDFPRKEVRVETGRTISSNTVVLPCQFRSDVPRTSLKIAGQPFDVTIDSGAVVGFEVPTDDNDFPFASPPIVVQASVNGSGISEEKAARLMTSITWGGIIFERPIVTISHRKTGIIGREVLEHFVVGLKWSARELYLTPATNRVTFPPLKSIGLGLLPDGARLKVAAVIPNTDASRAGIRPGDYITAVNNEPASKWTLQRLRAVKEEVEHFEITLDREGKSEQLKLRVSTLIP